MYLRQFNYMPSCYSTAWCADGHVWGELVFQYEDERRVCRRLILDYNFPTLRHGGVWVYHFPDRHQVSIRCSHGVTHSEILYDTGITHGATSCSIATSKVQTLPELRDCRHSSGHPDVYLSDVPPYSGSPRAAPNWADCIGKDGRHRLYSASPRLLDVDTLLHVRRTALSREDQMCWEWIVPSSACFGCLVLILFRFRITNQSSYPVPHCTEIARVNPRTPGLCVAVCLTAMFHGRQCVRKFARTRCLHELQFTKYGLNKHWLITQTQATGFATKDGFERS
jgi:hypothetical protein